MLTITGTKEEIESFAEGIVKSNITSGQCFLKFTGGDCSMPDFRPCECGKTDIERGIKCLTYHCKVEYI